MIPRTILPKLLALAGKPFVSVLFGPRQVGKTVLLMMLRDRLPSRCTYIDVENPGDAVVLRDGIRSLLSEIGQQPQVLLLDEFHRIPDALGLFKQLQDSVPQIKVYASGSSSIEIHSHLKQSAVGRVRRTRIFPLSFPEWCRHRIDLDLVPWDPHVELPPRSAAAAADLLEEFLVWGGMPQLSRADDEMERREILQEIVSLYLEKDVRSLLRTEEVLRFNDFLRLIAVRIGQTMNRSSFGRKLGITARKVTRQLAVMEHTFVLRPVATDYANPTKRLVKSPKIYWYDNGVRNALVKDFRSRRLRPDAGALLENHVFCELEKAAGIDVDILYHRTRDGQEVDFVLERDRTKLLVEVKSHLGRTIIPPAIRGLLGRDDVKAAVVLNDQIHSVLDHKGKPVLFLPHVLAHTLPEMLRSL